MSAISHPLRSNPAHLKNQSIFSTRFSTTLASLFTANQTLTQNPKPHHHRNHTKLITQNHSLLSLIKSCTHKSHLLQIHAHILPTSLILDSTICFHFLSLISLSPQFKTLTYSRHFLRHIPRPNAIHYNTVVRAYSLSDSPEEGIHLYRDMRRSGASNRCNALITMYSRCGCLDQAYQVFKGMRGRDVVSWSAMISGLAVNGYGRDAADAFCEMQRIGVVPDEQTFTGVLSACSHCGLVDEAMDIFDRMSKEF